jgi:hypothetical protein
VFGVKDSLIRPLEQQAPGRTPCGHPVTPPTALLRYDLVLAVEPQVESRPTESSSI